MLRRFDLSFQYGPCVGLTRLDRWNRAQSLNLTPPKEIGIILASEQAKEDTTLQESLWHGSI